MHRISHIDNHIEYEAMWIVFSKVDFHTFRRAFLALQAESACQE